jgi:hypothetical protein
MRESGGESGSGKKMRESGGESGSGSGSGSEKEERERTFISTTKAAS